MNAKIDKHIPNGALIFKALLEATGRKVTKLVWIKDGKRKTIRFGS